MEKFSHKHKTIKFISAFMVIAILASAILLSMPKKTQAACDIFAVNVCVEPGEVWTGFLIDQTVNESDIALSTDVTAGATGTNTGLHIKDIAVEVLKEIARTFAKKLLQKMTQATVNWINTGFHGAPLFVQNPSSFFRDVAKTEVRSLVTMFGYDPGRYPFGASFAQNLIGGFKSTLANNAAYSLSTAIRDPVYLNNYRTNFNVGGWNSFLTNTQYQQNNYLGFQMIATQEAARRLQGTVSNAAQKVQTTLNQGMGFLSPKTCPSNPKYNNGINEFQRPSFEPPPFNQPTPIYDATTGLETQASKDAEDAYLAQYNKDYAKAQLTFDDQNSCPGGLMATTPGSVVGNQIMNAISSSFRKTELGAAVGGSISAILDALLNKFFDTVTGGLTGSGLKNIDGTSYTTGYSTTPGTCSTGGANSIPLPSLKTQTDCVSLGGTWTAGASAPAPTDACTTATGGISITTKTDCDAIDGTWGTPPPAVFGYCLVGNNTSKTTKDACTLASGTWSMTAPQGTCTTNTDGTAGTCSIPAHATKAECEASNGTWSVTPTTQTTTTQAECKTGTWVPTPPAPLSAPLGTCKTGSGLILVMTEAQCSTVPSGVWTPTQTPTPPTPPVTSPAPTGLCSANGGSITTQADCSSGTWQEIKTCTFTDSAGQQESVETTQSGCGSTYHGIWKSSL